MHLLLELALQLLHACLKGNHGGGGLGATRQQSLAAIDPLLPLLVRCLACRHASTVSLALKCLAMAVTLPLPGGFYTLARRLFVRMFQVTCR